MKLGFNTYNYSSDDNAVTITTSKNISIRGLAKSLKKENDSVNVDTSISASTTI